MLLAALMFVACSQNVEYINEYTESIRESYALPYPEYDTSMDNHETSEVEGVASIIDDIPRFDFSSDAARAVELIEEIHPIFIIDGMLPNYYATRRAEFLSYTERPLSRTEFTLALRRYIATLQDGHMDFNTEMISGSFIRTPFVARDSRIFLAEQPHIEVLEIGGASISDIIYQVNRHAFHENESARMRNYSLHSRYEPILVLAGAENSAPGTFELTLYNDGTMSTMESGLTAIIPTGLPPQAPYIIRHEMIDDIFFIDLRRFVDGDHIDEVVEAIETAIAYGTHKFIIDLRSNSGGNNFVGMRLIEATGASMPTPGAIRRVSNLAAEQRRQWGIRFPDGVDRLEYIPDAETAQNPNGVFLSVLTDALTFSSATDMATWAQDGNLGNVIGEPSVNAPSSFGDMIVYTLPTSRIPLRISYTKFLRPDASADQTTLWPDIMVPAEDALDVAIEFLQNLEVGN